eukprot:scaffold108590_cov54-Attheya_sp.AAC.2
MLRRGARRLGEIQHMERLMKIHVQYGLIRRIHFNVNDTSRSVRIKMSHAMPFAEVIPYKPGVSIFQAWISLPKEVRLTLPQQLYLWIREPLDETLRMCGAMIYNRSILKSFDIKVAFGSPPVCHFKLATSTSFHCSTINSS